MRLNVFLAKNGICSRRKADFIIMQGKIRINGIVVEEPWYNVRNTDRVEYEEKIVQQKPHVYLVFHKPRGVVSTMKDSFAKRTVADFIPKKYSGVFPVGRLDKESEGLLFFTNDGEAAYKITHPKFMIEKEYLVHCSDIVSPVILQKFLQGVACGKEVLHFSSIRPLRSRSKGNWYKVIVKEGKKRHIRRVFHQAGLEVLTLKRVRIGKFRLPKLPPGKLMEITQSEFLKVFS